MTTDGKAKRGRSTRFSEDIARKIIESCRAGFTMEKSAELVGMEGKTVANWVYKRPSFGESIKKARREHELSLLKSIEVAGDKSWQAKAWIAERVYNYAQPSSRLEVAGAVAHAHAASPALAQILAGMNGNSKSVDGLVDGALQLTDGQERKLSESIGQRKVRRYSRRPTRRDTTPPTGQPPAPSATHNTPQKIATKNKKGSDASTTATNENPQESPQQAA